MAASAVSSPLSPFFILHKYIGLKISVILKSDIRWEGILRKSNPGDQAGLMDARVTLVNVKSFGTEDRCKDNVIPARDQSYSYIMFLWSDINYFAPCEPLHPDLFTRRSEAQVADPILQDPAQGAPPCNHFGSVLAERPQEYGNQGRKQDRYEGPSHPNDDDDRYRPRGGVPYHSSSRYFGQPAGQRADAHNYFLGGGVPTFPHTKSLADYDFETAEKVNPDDGLNRPRGGMRYNYPSRSRAEIGHFIGKLLQVEKDLNRLRDVLKRETALFFFNDSAL